MLVIQSIQRDQLSFMVYSLKVQDGQMRKQYLQSQHQSNYSVLFQSWQYLLRMMYKVVVNKKMSLQLCRHRRLIMRSTSAQSIRRHLELDLTISSPLCYQQISQQMIGSSREQLYSARKNESRECVCLQIFNFNINNCIALDCTAKYINCLIYSFQFWWV